MDRTATDLPTDPGDPVPEPPLSRRELLLKAGFSSASVAAGNSITQAIIFTANAVVARRLGPESFGLYAFAVSFAAFFSVFADFGFNSILVREITTFPQLTQSLIKAAARAKLILAPAAYLGAITVAILAGYSPTAISLVAVTALSILALAFGGVGDAGFAARLDMRRSAALKVLGSVAFAAAAWVVGSWWRSPQAFASAFLLVSFFPALSFPLFLRGAVAQGVRGDSAVLCRRMLVDAWPLGVAGLAVMLYTKFDLLLLTRFLGGRETGYYAGAARLNEVAYGVATALMVSIYPVLVRFRDAPSFRRLCRLGMRSMAAVAFCLLIGAFSSGRAVITIVYGEAFEPASRVLWVLVLGQPLAFCGLLMTAILTTCGEQRVVLESTVMAAACNVALNVFLVPRFGGAGAAWANVCSLLVSIAFPLLRPQARWLSLAVLREAGSASLLASVAVLMARLLPPDSAAGFGRALAGITCFAASWSFFSRADLATVFGVFLRRGEPASDSLPG